MEADKRAQAPYLDWNAMNTTRTRTALAAFAVGYAAGHADQLTARWLIARARRRKQAAA